ncbi:ubiquitin thioesterase OTUB [Acrasis kona]|uniref:ubiquitinyl hydrolase 1 n=1 Tax=Acrasis kona TaxID=1008807 RepID=A0AAW2YX92_9EUKA
MDHVDSSSFSMSDYERQQEEIESETKSSPIVGDKQSIESLRQAYNPDNEQVQKKINELIQNYSVWRTVRGDGNCFIRAFLFSVCEELVLKKDTTKQKHFQSVLKNSLESLVNLGYPEMLLDDFYSVLDDLVTEIGEGKIKSVDELQQRFVDPDTKDAIICYMRFLISAYMQLNGDEYIPYVLGTTDHVTMDSYCKTELEGMYKEVDNIIVSATCAACGVSLRLECVDAQNRDSTQQVQTITFPDQSEPTIFMLYRPGHYDILYKR